MGSRIFFTWAFFAFSLLTAGEAAAQGGGTAARELWCVANNNAVDAALQSALDWTCGAGGADCGPIQNGGACYDASDLQRTASYAFNDYYHKNGPSDDTCNFGNTASITSLNPSHGNCKFPSSLSSSNGNFSGSVTGGGSSSSDLNTSDSYAHHHHHHWVSITINLVFAVVMLIIV